MPHFRADYASRLPFYWTDSYPDYLGPLETPICATEVGEEEILYACYCEARRKQDEYLDRCFDASTPWATAAWKNSHRIPLLPFDAQRAACLTHAFNFWSSVKYRKYIAWELLQSQMVDTTDYGF